MVRVRDVHSNDSSPKVDQTFSPLSEQEQEMLRQERKWEMIQRERVSQSRQRSRESREAQSGSGVSGTASGTAAGGPVIQTNLSKEEFNRRFGGGPSSLDNIQITGDVKTDDANIDSALRNKQI